MYYVIVDITIVFKASGKGDSLFKHASVLCEWARYHQSHRKEEQVKVGRNRILATGIVLCLYTNMRNNKPKRSIVFMEQMLVLCGLFVSLVP